MKPFVSLEERENMPFKTYGAYGLKVVDLQKVSEQIIKERKEKGMSMEIHIIPVHPDRFKDPYSSITFSKDKLTGILYGIPIGLYEDGNVKWRKIIIPEHLDLDLSKQRDAEVWAVMRMSEKIEGTPLQIESNASPQFKLYDAEMEAQKDIIKIEDKMKAFTLAQQLKDKELISFARNVGASVTPTSTIGTIRGDIFKLADSNPTLFIEKWEDKDRIVWEVMKNALAVNVIVLDTQKGYQYHAMPMGMNEHQVVAKLNAEKDLFLAISKEIEHKDEISKRIVKTEKVYVEQPPQTDFPEDQLETVEETSEIPEFVIKNKGGRPKKQ